MNCPFTQEDVNTIEPCSLAVMIHRPTNQSKTKEELKCGHECHLSSLIDYKGRKCPYCFNIITDVYDGISNDLLLVSKVESSGEYDIVSFKYGYITYHLSIPVSKSVLAQERIAQVLDIEMKQLKILCKGKIVFNGSSKKQLSKDESSRDLVQTSILDREHKRKCSLVVMGTRKKEMQRATKYVGAGKDRREASIRGQVGYYLYFGMTSILGILRGLISGVFMFFKSILPGSIDTTDSVR
ncbi:hypothetical protein CTEN210_12348 [Chaetoceros tenuissimus]|uniref:Uncharacterized protein n=1 Tax=Chaetoceros tenuissimus TaxID=426638 RepID=A0AAD3D104_9STRA|nr:hypothetical protein CTEN210_12348 [Chaetoceros tenuissimus]